MTRLQANLCLLGVTFCWSMEVIIYACIPSDVSPYAVTCITSLLGALLLFILFYGRVVAAMREHGRAILWRAVLLGVLNCAYNLLYQFGLKDFDVSTGAFTLSLTVVILPVVLLVQRSGVTKRTLFSGGLVLIGIIIALSGTMHMNQLGGLSLIAIGCLLRAVFIIKLAEYAKVFDPVSLSAVTAVVVGVITYIPWLITQPATFSAITWSRTAIASLSIYAYFLVVFAQTLNFFAQKRTTPSNATIIYAMEIVFSVIWGAILPATLIDRVPVTPAIIIGIIFVVLGNIVEILEPKESREAVPEPVKADGAAAGAPAAVKQVPQRKEIIQRIGRLFRGHGLAVLNMTILYFLIAVPFKVLSVIPGFTDIRPVTLLGPIYAVFFGVPGCTVMALGNLVMDAVSNSLRWSSIGGLIANFLGPYVIYLYWTRRAKRPFSLKRGSLLLQCVGIIIVSAIVEAVIITPMVAAVYPDVNAGLFAVSVLLNTSAFPIFFGMPAMMVMQEELGLRPMPLTREVTT